MSLRLTRTGFLAALDDPSTRGLRAYQAGRRWLRDDGGHGGGNAGGEDDKADEEDDSDEEDEDASDEDEDDDKETKGKKKDKKKDDEEDEEVVPKWKYDKAHSRMTAADRRSSELQKQIDALKASADVPAEVKRELEELRPKVAQAEKERDDARAEVGKLQVKVAFFSINDTEWEDPETALQLADLSDVDVSDDGKVDKRALKAALRDLAKRKPYLVKKKAAKGDNTNEGEASGSKMAGGRKGQKGTSPTREQLAASFPALRRVG